MYKKEAGFGKVSERAEKCSEKAVDKIKATVSLMRWSCQIIPPTAQHLFGRTVICCIFS